MTLCRNLSDLSLDLHAPETVIHARDVFLYLSGIDNAFAFQRKFKPICKEVSAKKFRLSFATNAYFSVNLKYAFLAAGMCKMTPDNMSKIQHDFGITHNDMVMLKRVILMRGVRAMIKGCGYKPSDVTKLRMEADKIVYGELLPDIMRVIQSITYKRMRFISSSTNTEFSDLNNQLACKSLSTFYSLMPIRLPIAHVRNYVLRALNNEAINMIDSSTSAKNGRLVQGAKDGFGGNNYDLMIVSNNQIKNEEGDTAYDDLGNDGSDITETLDFDRLLRKYGSSPSRRDFLMLITGHDDPLFTDFLRKQRCLRSGEDSVDYYNRAKPDEYQKSVNQYLGVDADLSKAFLGFLGKALGR